MSGATSLLTISSDICIGCSSLGGTITIPALVTSVGAAAFASCSNLDDAPVTFLGNAPTAGNGVFVDATPTTGTYYEGTTGWGATWSDLTMRSIPFPSALEPDKTTFHNG